jgi:conjugal transfer pilin signal peptidase TrbI
MTELAAPARRPFWRFAWLLDGARMMRADLRRLSVPYLILAAVWIVACLRLFGNVVTDLPLRFNWTPSLPYRVVWVERSDRPLARGEFVVYRFVGAGADGDQRALKDQPLFKQVAGLPGDVVTVVDRDVFVNGEPMGRAKVRTFNHKPLSPIAPVTIPDGFVYVRGTSPDSFDSRYSAAGLVPASAILSRVRPLF